MDLESHSRESREVPSSFATTQKKLAENVKRFRKALQLSQEDLAFNAGIDRTYASQIERAIANPSLAIICNLADALNCSVNDLIT